MKLWAKTRVVGILCWGDAVGNGGLREGLSELSDDPGCNRSETALRHYGAGWHRPGGSPGPSNHVTWALVTSDIGRDAGIDMR